MCLDSRGIPRVIFMKTANMFSYPSSIASAEKHSFVRHSGEAMDNKMPVSICNLQNRPKSHFRNVDGFTNERNSGAKQHSDHEMDIEEQTRQLSAQSCREHPETSETENSESIEIKTIFKDDRTLRSRLNNYKPTSQK